MTLGKVKVKTWWDICSKKYHKSTVPINTNKSPHSRKGGGLSKKMINSKCWLMITGLAIGKESPVSSIKGLMFSVYIAGKRF